MDSGEGVCVWEPGSGGNSMYFLVHFATNLQLLQKIKFIRYFKNKHSYSFSFYSGKYSKPLLDAHSSQRVPGAHVSLPAAPQGSSPIRAEGGVGLRGASLESLGTSQDMMMSDSFRHNLSKQRAVIIFKVREKRRI